MTPRALALLRAEPRLIERAVLLEQRIKAGDESAWPDYNDVVRTLAALSEASARSGDLLTTGQLADRLGVSSKTILRRKARGEFQPAAVLGQRGRAALRWRP